MSANILICMLYHYLKAPDTEKRNIVSELLWNLSVKDRKIAQVSYRNPYDILAKAPKNGDIFTLCAVWNVIRTELMVA